MAKVCGECGSDTTMDDGQLQHFGGCSKHPNNVALAKRNVEKLSVENQQAVLNPSNGHVDFIERATTTPKFILPEASMILPEETMRKAMECFFKYAMGLDVEVTGFTSEFADHSSTNVKVTFKGK